MQIRSKYEVKIVIFQNYISQEPKERVSHNLKRVLLKNAPLQYVYVKRKINFFSPSFVRCKLMLRFTKIDINCVVCKHSFPTFAVRSEQ